MPFSKLETTTFVLENPSSPDAESDLEMKRQRERKANCTARLRAFMKNENLAAEIGERTAMYAGMESYYYDPQPWPWLPSPIPFKSERSQDDYLAGYCFARTLGLIPERG